MPMRLAHRLKMPLMTVILCAAMTAGAAAAPSQAPDQFITHLSKEAISSLTQPQISGAEREKRFRALFTNNFDVPAIARFVLGLYWRRTTPEQRKEFVNLFEDFIVKSYAKQFGSYSGEGVTIKQTVKVSPTDSLVMSTLKPHDAPQPVRVDWRVHDMDSAYKIRDVLVEGISMSVTHRDEFAAVIRNSGGDVEGLLTALRNKVR
jgi:phospholipid transport system substrate-binding protein